jgi:hypothetical protein
VTTAAEFVPGRFVTELGERVRPFGAELVPCLDVLTRQQSIEASMSVLRLARETLAHATKSHILRRLDRSESDYDEMARRRSGPSGKPWTEEQYAAAGIELLHFRMRPEVHGPLDELAERWGFTGRTARADAIRRALAEAHAREFVPRRSVTTEQPPDESFVATKSPGNNRPRKEEK